MERVTSSPTGRWLCLHGGRGVACVELPRRAGRAGRFAGGDKTVTVRSVIHDDALGFPLSPPGADVLYVLPLRSTFQTSNFLSE